MRYADRVYQFLLVFRICLPFNPLRIALFAVIVGGFTLCVFFLHSLFSLVPLPWMQLTALLICAAGAFVVLSGMLYLFEHMGKKKKPKITKTADTFMMCPLFFL